MKQTASMRPDELIVTTTGVRGGKSHTNKQGSVKVTALKDYDSRQGTQRSENVIWVDVFSGHGETYKPREDALINIQFSDNTMFSGTFDQLKEIFSALRNMRNISYPTARPTTEEKECNLDKAVAALKNVTFK